jgi:hypothetical protein
VSDGERGREGESEEGIKGGKEERRKEEREGGAKGGGGRDEGKQGGRKGRQAKMKQIIQIAFYLKTRIHDFKISGKEMSS